MQPQHTQRFQATSPAGHMIISEYNPIKKRYDGFVIDHTSGTKKPLTHDILEGIEAAMRAEELAQKHKNAEEDWQISAHEIKERQCQYLKHLVGQAADILVARKH